MKNIIGLINIISKQKIKQIQIVSEKGDQKSKYSILYEQVKSGNINSIDEGVELLYGTNTETNKEAFIRLKNRLHNRLLNTLFFIDVNQADFTDYRKAKFSSYKNWALINILIDRLARKNAIELCETTFKKANKYDFTDLKVGLARILMNYYGYISPNNKKFEKYEKEVFENLALLEIELKSEVYYAIIAKDYADKKASKSKAFLNMLTNYCSELSILCRNYTSHTLMYNYYQLLSFKSILEKNYTISKDVCYRALSYFDKKPYVSKFITYSFRQDLIYCHINMREFDDAHELIIKNIKLLQPGSFNWFRQYNFLFMWASLKEDYQTLYDVTSLITNNNRFRDYQVHEQSWLVKEAYIHFLVRIEKIDPELSSHKNLRSFKLGKFLNEVPIYSKDKRGLNISILIIQMLYLIINKKYGQVIDRIDALKQYSYRYLRNDETFRSNCFIKMLIKIPECDFNQIRIKRHSEIYLKKLIETPIHISEQSAEIEIIPYEKLWRIVINLLDK